MSNATTVRYQPQGACARLFSDRSTELLIGGPAGTGKSMACLFRLHLVCMDARNQGVRCLVVRKTMKSLGATTLVTFRERVAREAIGAGICHYFGGNVEEAAAYRYPATGSAIVVGGMDNPTKIMSGEYDLIFVDEATELTANDWEHLATRLRHGALSWQQLIGACNPAHPTHWLKLRADAGDLTLLESRHEDNPTLYRDGVMTAEGERYIGILDRLTGVRRHRLRLGQWAAAEGVIYEGWDPALHLVDPFPIPWEWTRWWSVDFGYRHPFVLQCWAEDPDGRLFMYREIFHTKRLVEDHARQILGLVTDDRTGRWTEPRPRAILCDHDAEDRATLERHLEMRTQAAQKTVSDGIQAVQARLRPEIEHDARPRLFIFRDALVERDPELENVKAPTCTAEEIPGYIWLPPSPGRAAKEQPLKEQDDGCDAMRYMVAERDLGSRPQIHHFG